MVLSKYEVPKFVKTSQISVSQRGEDGFGSTGKK
jgi:dUTPase